MAGEPRLVTGGTPVPRPIDYAPELADEICRHLSAGLALKAIAALPHMPDVATIAGWVIDDREGFGARYERARQVRAMVWEDDVLEIADDGSGDWKETARGMTANSDHIQRAKLRVEVRKWLLGKWLPKQFGDKLGLAGDGNTPLEVTVVRFSDDPDTP